MNATAALVNMGIAPVVFNDQNEYIRLTRRGLPGKVLQQIIDIYGHRELFIHLLETTASNLSRFYKKKTLDEGQSEKILDTVNLFLTAEKVFGDFNTAGEWINTNIPALGNKKPIELCDTFKGREMVADALRKIEFGELI
jgi:putative toxin-antitoxin system antitoxin component (TIGR02293 family)